MKLPAIFSRWRNPHETPREVSDALAHLDEAIEENRLLTEERENYINDLRAQARRFEDVLNNPRNRGAQP